jgi:hypothetical protein
LADTDEKFGLTRARNARLVRARNVAKMLDSAVRVPGTGIRFGLDSVLGLIPGMGDAAGAVFSGYLILMGSRMGVPKHVITRMVANVAIDTIVGGIPVLGDLFDVAWKSNTRNLALLEQFAAPNPRDEAQPVNKLVVIAALLVLLLLVAAGIWLAFVAIKALVGAIS